MAIKDDVYKSFKSKTTEELQRIWNENDRNEYSSVAFEAIEEILNGRNEHVEIQDFKTDKIIKELKNYSENQKKEIKKTNSEIRGIARETLSGNWAKSIFVVLICFLIEFFLNQVAGANMFPANSSQIYFGFIIVGLIYAPLYFGRNFFFLNLTRNNAKIGQIFIGYKYYIGVVGLMFCTGILILLWSLLFLIPGIVAAYRYSMAYFILADNPNIGVLAAITKSKEIMVGNKAKLFLLHLSFTGWFLLSILFASFISVFLQLYQDSYFAVHMSLGVGLIFIRVYYWTSLATLYENIKQQQEVVVEVVE